MGLESIGQGLLFALTGGAKGYGTAVADQAEEARKNQAKMDENQQLEELRLQREKKILEMKQQFETDNLPNELEKIRARAKAASASDPATEALRWAQADKARNDVERDKEARASDKDIQKQREDLAKAKLLAKNDPSLQSLVDARQTKLDTMLGNRNKTDPLSSGVAAAKAVLADFEATDEQKANARNFLDNALQGQAGSKPASAGQEVRYDSAGNGYIKGPDGKPQLVSKAK